MYNPTDISNLTFPLSVFHAVLLNSNVHARTGTSEPPYCYLIPAVFPHCLLYLCVQLLHTRTHKNMYALLLFIHSTLHPELSYKVPPSPLFYRYNMLRLSVTPHCDAVFRIHNIRYSRENRQEMEVRLRLLAPTRLT